MLRNCSSTLLLLLMLLAGCAGGPAGQAPTPSPGATATPMPSATPQGAPSPAAAPSATPQGAPPAQATPGGPLTLRVGETGGAGRLTLALLAIENDSRCPTQVSCVWEGAAEARVEVAVAGQRAEAATLTLFGHNRETDESRVEVAGYTVRFTALEPYPADPQPIAQGAYVATFAVEEAPAAYALVGDGSFEGVIIPARDARGLDPRAEGYWTPAERDVLGLEAGLAAFLRAAAPAASPELWQKQSSYKRQYAGLVVDGRRLVYASFFCTTPGDEWRRRVLFVMDGGDCYFQLTYDVERGVYGELMVNGES